LIFGLPGHISYFIYSQPTDMLKSFDGLGGIVRNELGRNPLSGDIFIFINRRRTMIKILVWDNGGFVIYYKRLETGTFEMPLREEHERSIQIGRDDLMMILEGIKLENVKKNKRFLSRNIIHSIITCKMGWPNAY